VVQNLKIAESSVFIFSQLFVWHSSDVLSGRYQTKSFDKNENATFRNF